MASEQGVSDQSSNPSDEEVDELVAIVQEACRHINTDLSANKKSNNGADELLALHEVCSLIDAGSGELMAMAKELLVAGCSTSVPTEVSDHVMSSSPGENEYARTASEAVLHFTCSADGLLPSEPDDESTDGRQPEQHQKDTASAVAAACKLRELQQKFVTPYFNHDKPRPIVEGAHMSKESLNHVQTYLGMTWREALDTACADQLVSAKFEVCCYSG